MDTSAENLQTVGANLAFELMASVSTIRRRVRRSPPPSGITSTQAELLRLIFHEPGLPAARLASSLHVAPNTVSSLLRQLTDLGFIVRKRDPDDLRIARFEVTDAGEQYAVAARDFRIAALTSALEQMPPDDRSALEGAIPALQHLADRLV